jgi:hypothetical protein
MNMNDAELMRLLKAWHELDVQDAPRQHRLRTPQCLPLPRLLNPLAVWSDVERQHVESCPYCLMVLDRRLPSAAAVARGPFRLPNPTVKAARGAPESAARQLVRSEDGRLEVKLFDRDTPPKMEVRSRSAGLSHHLVRYRLASAAGPETETGVVLLTPDRGHWQTASVTLPADAFDRLGEEVTVEATPLDVGDLTADECAKLLESAPALPADDPARAAWLSWAEQTAATNDDLAEDVRQWLHDLIGRRGQP